MEPILIAENICQYFGGVHAVDGVSLQVNPGEIFGIIGPNGSGKSTLFNSLTGIYKPNSGRFLYQGKDITGLAPHLIVKCGISRTFQNIRSFSAMTVLENVVVGQHINQKVGVFDSLFRTNRYRKEEKYCYQKAIELVELVGLSHIADHLSCEMSYGQQKRLELARVMASDAKVILLDEPTAGIPRADAIELMKLIMRIREERRATIIVIEHNMQIIKSLADRIMVMDRGKMIAEGYPEDVLRDPIVIQAYLGEE